MDKYFRKSMRGLANRLPGGKKGKLSNASVGGGPPGGGSGKGLMYPSSGATPIPAPSTQVNDEYVSKFNYEATKDDELSLTKGMRVMVLKTEEDGWWYGRDAECLDQPGWFPSNYVVKSDPTSTLSNTAASKPQTNGNSSLVVRTMFPFHTENPEELEFDQDELLDIIEEPHDDPEWWLARNHDGQVGLVPKNYVESLSDAQATSHAKKDAATAKSNQNNDHTIPNSVESKDWFFGPLRRSEAEALLSDRAKNGEYLVRNCETSAGEYSISMKMPGRIRHFKITVQSDGQFGIGQKRFDSIDNLIAHYKRLPIFTNQEQGKFYLTNPLSR